ECSYSSRKSFMTVNCAPIPSIANTSMRAHENYDMANAASQLHTAILPIPSPNN
ncbi:273_t:CDS:2, partial [Rhizophagus irregularis]